MSKPVISNKAVTKNLKSAPPPFFDDSEYENDSELDESIEPSHYAFDIFNYCDNPKDLVYP